MAFFALIVENAMDFFSICCDIDFVLIDLKYHELAVEDFVRAVTFFVVSKYENVRAGIHSLGLPIDSRLIFRFFLFAPLVVLRCSVACSLCSCILYRLVSLAHRLPAWLDPRASWPD